MSSSRATMSQITPSRRAVVRASAWSTPAILVAVAAPASAACSQVDVSGVLDWDGSGVSFSRADDRRSASATYTKAGAAPLTLTISTHYVEMMRIGPETGSSTNFDRPARVGNLGTSAVPIGGLKLHQSNHRSKPLNENGKGNANARRTDRGEYTFTFDRDVKNLSFAITDIDSTTGDFRDAVELTPGFAFSNRAGGVAGTGTTTDPFKSNQANLPADNVTGSSGNVTITYPGLVRSFTITYWNVQDDFTTDTDQAAFITDMSFDYSPTSGCSPQW